MHRRKRPPDIHEVHRSHWLHPEGVGPLVATIDQTTVKAVGIEAKSYEPNDKTKIGSKPGQETPKNIVQTTK